MRPNWQDELKIYFGGLGKSRATHPHFVPGPVTEMQNIKCLRRETGTELNELNWGRAGSCTAAFPLHCPNGAFKHDPRAKLGLLSFGVKYVSGILLLLLTDFGQWQITFSGFGVTEPKPGLVHRGLLLYLVCIQIPLREPRGLSSHQPCHKGPKASTLNTVQPSHTSTYN